MRWHFLDPPLSLCIPQQPVTTTVPTIASDPVSALALSAPHSLSSQCREGALQKAIVCLRAGWGFPSHSKQKLGFAARPACPMRSLTQLLLPATIICLQGFCFCPFVRDALPPEREDSYPLNVTSDNPIPPYHDPSYFVLFFFISWCNIHMSMGIDFLKLKE